MRKLKNKSLIGKFYSTEQPSLALFDFGYENSIMSQIGKLELIKNVKFTDLPTK